MNSQIIEFVNGSTITMLPSTEPQDPHSIIGVDISSGQDCSCVAYRCGGCGVVLGADRFEPNEDIHIVSIKKCSECGNKFKRSYIFK